MSATTQSSRPVIVWFRDDLRLSDHPALHNASKSGAPVICLYVFDEASRAVHLRPPGGAARWWLAQSLKALQASLRPIGAGAGTGLVLRRGPAARIIPELAGETKAQAVFWNEIAQAPHRDIAGEVAAGLDGMGVGAQQFPGDLLAAPSAIRTKEGRGLKVFTPFWRRIQAVGDPPAPLPAPKSLRMFDGPASEPLESWRLEPHHPDWAGGLRGTWTPGEAAARRQLKRFLAHGVKSYAENRDRPDREATSRLSPHLRFGEISPRQVWHAARFAAAEHPALAGDIDKFLSELGWREFCRHLLFDAPDLAEAICKARSTPFPGDRTTRPSPPGSAAGPATPSSTPGCASSGTPG